MNPTRPQAPLDVAGQDASAGSVSSSSICDVTSSITSV
jgi:hypothetical protein